MKLFPTRISTTRLMIKKALKTLLIILFWLCVWQVLSMIVGLELLLPSPIRTLKRLFELAGTLSFYGIILRSLARILIGTAAAVALGVALAILTARFKLLHDFVSPLMTVIKAIPVASFIVLLLLWMGRDILPSIISALIVLPIVWTSVETGILQTDKSLLEMARVYKMSPWGKVRHIYAPATLPYFVSALNSSLGLAWKAGIAAEVLALPAIAIGKQIYESKLYIETVDLFAWTLTVILISLVIEKLIVFAIRKATSSKMILEVAHDKA